MSCEELREVFEIPENLTEKIVKSQKIFDNLFKIGAFLRENKQTLTSDDFIAKVNEFSADFQAIGSEKVNSLLTNIDILTEIDEFETFVDTIRKECIEFQKSASTAVIKELVKNIDHNEEIKQSFFNNLFIEEYDKYNKVRSLHDKMDTKEILEFIENIKIFHPDSNFIHYINKMDCFESFAKLFYEEKERIYKFIQNYNFMHVFVNNFENIPERIVVRIFWLILHEFYIQSNEKYSAKNIEFINHLVEAINFSIIRLEGKHCNYVDWTNMIIDRKEIPLPIIKAIRHVHGDLYNECTKIVHYINCRHIINNFCSIIKTINDNIVYRKKDSIPRAINGYLNNVENMIYDISNKLNNTSEGWLCVYNSAPYEIRDSKMF